MEVKLKNKWDDVVLSAAEAETDRLRLPYSTHACVLYKSLHYLLASSIVSCYLHISYVIRHSLQILQ